MNEHMSAWIAAYHDGELPEARRGQVESHLQKCPACQAELEALKSLSALLQENPAMPVHTPPERFVAQVRLRLPPHPTPPASKQSLKTGWLALALGLLGMWAFLQAVLLVSGLVLRLLPWFGGLAGAEALEAYPGESLSELFLFDTGLTLLLATLVWGWLATWWAVWQKNVPSSGN